jgi:hypothetical protein
MASDVDIDNLLEAAGPKKGHPSFRFQKRGDKIVGTVKARNVVSSVSLRGDGTKDQNLVLEVETDNEITQVNRSGEAITSREWSIWFKSPSQMLAALAAELKEKNATKGAPRPGDRIAVEYFDDEPPTNPAHSPKKLHRVSYKAGAGDKVSSADDLL